MQSTRHEAHADTPSLSAGLGLRTRLAAALALALAGLPVAHASELGELLQQTLTHPSIEARAQDTLAAREALAAQTSRYFGGGGAYADVQRYDEARFTGVLTSASLASPPFARDQYRYGVSYMLPIDVFGAVAAARSRAKQDLAVAELAERQTSLLKLHQATSAYVELQALQRRLGALRVQRERLALTAERVRREVEIQQSSQLDQHLIESELARLRADEARLQAAVGAAEAALKEASGHEGTIRDADTPIPTWPLTREATLPERSADAHGAAAEAQAREAWRRLWPSLSAVADYTHFDGRYDGGARAEPDTWSVGARLSIPLDAAAVRQARAASAQAEAAAQERLAVAREAERQLNSLRASYDSAMADAEALQQEVEYREDVVHTQSELQRVGLKSLEDVLHNERDLQDATARLATARAQAVAAWSAAAVLRGIGDEQYIASFQR